METNIVDPVFNGRLLDKLKPYLSSLKKEGLVGVILIPPLTIFMLFGLIYAFVDVNFKTENPAGFYTAIICSSAFSILFFVFFIYSIKLLITRANFKKDYNQKSLSTINELPYKVKIIKDRPGKHSDALYLKSAVLYFTNLKLVIPFDFEVINNKHNIKKCCKECSNIKAELKYLTKSKIIIDGEEKFIKIIKKHLL